jgi:putative FmdB family regulatory protein
MPIYEYKCGSCSSEFEVLQGMNDPPPERCSQCGGPLERMLSSPSLNFGKHTSRSAARRSKLTVEEEARREHHRLAEHSKKTGIPLNDLFEAHD